MRSVAHVYAPARDSDHLGNFLTDVRLAVDVNVLTLNQVLLIVC